MAITINSVTTNILSNGGTSISVTTPAASIGDLLVIILNNDFDTMAAISLGSVTPTATATAITSFNADGGTNNPHTKGWWAPVVTAGAVTVTGNTTDGGEETSLIVYILSGADTVSPVDTSTSSALATDTTGNLVAPSVSPTASTDLLICHVQTDGSTAGFTATITAPGDLSNTYSIFDSGHFMRSLGGSKVLTASGATGTEIWTADRTDVGYVASTVAIKAGAGGGANTASVAWLHA